MESWRTWALLWSRLVPRLKMCGLGTRFFSPEKGVAYTMALRHRHAGKKSRLRKDDQRERDVPTGVLSIKSYLTPYWVGAAALGERDLHNPVAYHCACASSVLIWTAFSFLSTHNSCVSGPPALVWIESSTKGVCVRFSALTHSSESPTAFTCTSSLRMTGSSHISLPLRGSSPSEQKWSVISQVWAQDPSIMDPGIPIANLLPPFSHPSQHIT